jgi:hypothetical protein
MAASNAHVSTYIDFYDSFAPEADSRPTEAFGCIASQFAIRAATGHSRVTAEVPTTSGIVDTTKLERDHTFIQRHTFCARAHSAGCVRILRASKPRQSPPLR